MPNLPSSLRLTAVSAFIVMSAASSVAAQVLQPGLQPGLTKAPDSARKISLQEAVAMAQQNSPQAVAAEGTERTSKAARTSAVGAILPSASLSVGHTVQFGSGQTRINQNGEQVTVAQQPTNNVGLNLNMTLFDGGQRLYALRTAKSDIAAAEANSVAVKYNVALQVKQQYYAVLAAIESADAARLQMAQAQEQFKSSVIRVRAGVATRSDSLRGVIQVGNAQLALITAQSNKEAADAALTRLVGSSVPVTADPASVQENMGALPDSAQLAQLARNGPAVQQAQANLDAATENRKAARGQYLPSLSLSYSRSGSGTDPRFGFGSDPFAYSGRLSFSLSYPLFNNFQREENVVRARVSEINAEADLRDAQLAAVEALTQAIGAIRGASQRVAVQVASVAAAQEDVRVQQQRYNIGASTLLDLITSQAALATAEQALIQARYDYRIARAQLEALIGRDLQ
ncbi:MAG TPA: TolC family protein [Gemmatimonadaceae bacterium]|nr:TolC family protein [Gemmatimonadaceae bacterium]